MHPFTQHQVQCRHVSRLSQPRGFTGASAVRWLSQLSQAVYLSVSIPAACASPVRPLPLRVVLWVNGVRNDLPAVPAYQASERLYGAQRRWLLAKTNRQCRADVCSQVHLAAAAGLVPRSGNPGLGPTVPPDWQLGAGTALQLGSVSRILRHDIVCRFVEGCKETQIAWPAPIPQSRGSVHRAKPFGRRRTNTPPSTVGQRLSADSNAEQYPYCHEHTYQLRAALYAANWHEVDRPPKYAALRRTMAMAMSAGARRQDVVRLYSAPTLDRSPVTGHCL